MNLKKLKESFQLEDMFKNIINDIHENNNLDIFKGLKSDETVIDYFKRLWSLECLNRKWLNKKILYHRFDTRTLGNQTDIWILIGITVNAFTNEKYVVWWNDADKMIFMEQTLDEFFEDLITNTYEIKKLNYFNI